MKKDRYVPMPCDCDPTVNHGAHWVADRRLKKGGDLHGQVDPAVLEDMEADLLV